MGKMSLLWERVDFIQIFCRIFSFYTIQTCQEGKGIGGKGKGIGGKGIGGKGIGGGIGGKGIGGGIGGKGIQYYSKGYIEA